MKISIIYIILIFSIIPIYAGQEVISPAEVSPPVFTGVPNQGGFTTRGETLYYDDGTAANAWAWYEGGNGWGYYFDGYGPSDVIAVGFYIWAGWPVPGSNTCRVRVTDWNNGQPGTIYTEEEVTVTPGAWTWYHLQNPVSDPDGKFCVFYIQEGAYPNCAGLACDAVNEDPNPDWYYYIGSYGNGFPGGDFMIRAVLST